MIFAHIAGLSQKHKLQLYQKYGNSKYIFKDLDDFTDLIMEDKNMMSLIHKYEYYLDKSKNPNMTKIQAKQFLAKSREHNTKINIYWKSRLEFYVNDFEKEIDENIVNKDKFTILLGYCNFYRNIRIFNAIKTINKIFIDIPLNDYTKEIVTINLDEYRNDIIEGNFSLDLINPSFLSKRRETVASIYVRHSYEKKSFDECLLFLGNSLENYEVPDVLFYASKYKYSGRIPLKSITAYTDEWMAIVSAFNDKKLIKGYVDDNYNKPFIQELSKGRINELKKKLYIYVITNTALFIPIFTKNYIYKYKLNQSAQISKSFETDSAYRKLKELNISFVSL